VSVTRTRRRSFGGMRAFDASSAAEAFSGPGRDTRTWCSYGIVAGDGDPPVEFNEDEGQVYVRVRLEPSKVPVFARIAASIAGAGEGEYNPFVDGDEVVLLLPSGREDSGAVIVGRLNNALDRLPMESVAGQDPKTNSFAFRRQRTPFVQELAGPVVFRSAASGALFMLADDGSVTIKDGENAALQMSPDAFSVQGPSTPESPPRYLLQINYTESRGVLQIDDAQILLNGSGAPSFAGELYVAVPGAVTIAIGNNVPVEHVATTEFVVGALTNILTQIGVAAAALPVTAAHIGTGIAAWLATVASGGTVSTTLTPLAATSLAAGLPLAARLPKPPPSPTGVQLTPGLGAVHFKTG